MLHRPRPAPVLGSLLVALLMCLLSLQVVPASAAKPASFERQLLRLLGTDTELSTKGATARCLHQQAGKALKAGKAPNPSRVASACKVDKVGVSRLAKTTAPDASRDSVAYAAAVVASLLRRKENFTDALRRHDHLAVASKTIKGRAVAVAVTSTAPTKADPTLAGGNKAPVARIVGRVNYRVSDLTVALDGTQSFDDKGVVSYEWAVGDGETRTPIGSGPSLVWTAPTYATHLFFLTVTDAQGARHTSAGVSVNVWRSVTRSEFASGLRESLNSIRQGQNGLPALSENSCLTAAAQKQAEALADQPSGTAAFNDTAAATACKRTSRGTVTDTDPHDYNLRIRIFDSAPAAMAVRDASVTTLGVGFAHIKDGPGYYAVFITA